MCHLKRKFEFKRCSQKGIRIFKFTSAFDRAKKLNMQKLGVASNVHRFSSFDSGISLVKLVLGN